MTSTRRVVVVAAMVMSFLTFPLTGQDSEKKSWWYGIFGAGVETGTGKEFNYWHYGGGL